MIVCVSVYWLGLEQMSSWLGMLDTELNTGSLTDTLAKDV